MAKEPNTLELIDLKLNYLISETSKYKDTIAKDKDGKEIAIKQFYPGEALFNMYVNRLNELNKPKEEKKEEKKKEEPKKK